MPEGPILLSGDVPEAEGWQTEVLMEGFVHPWSLKWISPDSLLISERQGTISVINVNEGTKTLISGLPDMYTDGQAGLMDISLHPHFDINRYIYVTFAKGDENANQTAVARGELKDDRLVNTSILFTAEPMKSDNQHFGSRMVWLPDTTLLVSVGDGGNRPQKIDGTLSREYAQDVTAHIGKILRLNEDGSPPENNPFFNDPVAKPEIWSLGHRNIQGLTVDYQTGAVWANEHGSRGGDELNLIKKGENYGWPEVTYSREYWYTKISDKTEAPGMMDPKVVWTPAQSPSGIAVYDGDLFPEWEGNIFSGGLKGEQIRRVVLDGEMVIKEEKLTIGRRVRDVKEGPDGFLYVLTDEENGKLIRIVPKTE